MNDNSILNFTIGTDSKNLLQKSTQIIFLLLIFSVLYSLFQLVDWYFFLKNSGSSRLSGDHFFYYYRLSPLISVTEMALSILSYTFVYRSFKCQSTAVNTEDAGLYNKGLRFFNISLMISVVYFLILFANFLYRFLIIKYR
jgi:hypothetical protein